MHPLPGQVDVDTDEGIGEFRRKKEHAGGKNAQHGTHERLPKGRTTQSPERKLPYGSSRSKAPPLLSKINANGSIDRAGGD
jgi:hypothetical protein